MKQPQKERNIFIRYVMATVSALACCTLAFPAGGEVEKPPAYATIGQAVRLDYTLPLIGAIKETKSDETSKNASMDKNVSKAIDQTSAIDEAIKRGREDNSSVDKPTLNLIQAKGKKSLVLFFFSEQCGVTFFYKSRLQQIQKDFEGKGFTFIGVRGGKRQNPNEPLELAETNYLKMPFVDDANGALIRYFRVRQSLTFAVIDREGRLRYRGGFDDSVDAAHVKKSYLRSALRDIAAGKPVAVKEGDAIGCAIVVGP